MYHSESGVGVFNRRHLFLTSLPCLSLLPVVCAQTIVLPSRVTYRGFKRAKKRMQIFKHAIELSNVLTTINNVKKSELLRLELNYFYLYFLYSVIIRTHILYFTIYILFVILSFILFHITLILSYFIFIYIIKCHIKYIQNEFVNAEQYFQFIA